MRTVLAVELHCPDTTMAKRSMRTAHDSKRHVSTHRDRHASTVDDNVALHLASLHVASLIFYFLVCLAGIEPACTDSQSVKLPLFYRHMETSAGFEPACTVLQTVALPLGQLVRPEERVGFEPTGPRISGSCGFQDRCLRPLGHLSVSDNTPDSTMLPCRPCCRRSTSYSRTGRCTGRRRRPPPVRW